MVQNINYKKKYLKYKLKYEKMCNQKGGMWLLGFSQEDHMGSHESENAWAKEQEHTSNKAATNIQRVLRGFLGRELTMSKREAFKKLTNNFSLTYDEARNVLSSDQTFLDFMQTKDNNGNPHFFTYLVDDVDVNIDMLNLLINIGLDIDNTVDNEGRPAISYAANRGSHKILNFLISMGANVNKRCVQGATPLHYALMSENYNSVKILLENDANINLADVNGNTHLHYAISNSSSKLVIYLIKSGADINLVNNNGFTVLDIAQNLGRTNIVNYIKTLGEA